MQGKSKYGLLGDAASVPSGINDHLELIPLPNPNDPAAGLQGILIAGADNNPGAVTIAKYFDAGLSVAALSPDDALMTALTEASGVTSSREPLVLFTPVPGSNAAHFRVASSGLTQGQRFDSDGTASTGSEAPVIDGKFFAAPEPLVRAPSLQKTVRLATAEPGAAYGHRSESRSFDEVLPRVFTCDKRMKERKTDQRVSGTYTGDLYCYWVDGPSETPRFVVILIQDLWLNPACHVGGDLPSQQMYAWEGWSKGMFMPLLDFKPLTFDVQTSENGTNWTPIEGGKVFLDSFGPNADSTRDGQNFEFRYPKFSMRKKESGGRSGQFEFEPAYATDETFKSWRTKNVTSGLRPGLRFHQDDVWNPITEPPSTFVHWHKNIYDTNSNNHVKELPAQSRSMLVVSSISAWKILAGHTASPGQAPKPKPTQVRIAGAVEGLFVAIHNWEGCTSVNGHHIGAYTRTWGFDKTFRLDEICAPA
jgi:hypothetical protein